jgi:hypothetical protein
MRLTRLTMSEPQKFQSIELDCPPGMVRPNDLFDAVVKDLGIEPISRDVPCMFGHSEWFFRIDRPTWEAKYQPTIKERVERLYNSGVIRYGSW